MYILVAILLVFLGIVSITFIRKSSPPMPAPSTTSSMTPPAAPVVTPPATPPAAPLLLELSSPAFSQNGTIPLKYTCDGGHKLSPPLTMTGVPAGAKSLVLIMEDPDIPQVAKNAIGADVYDHWVLYDIPANTAEVPEGTAVGTVGLNSNGTKGYVSPCPPTNYEPSEHRYIFTLYALDALLSLPSGATKAAVLTALAPHMIEKTELIGRYSRK